MRLQASSPFFSLAELAREVQRGLRVTREAVERLLADLSAERKNTPEHIANASASESAARLIA